MERLMFVHYHLAAPVTLPRMALMSGPGVLCPALFSALRVNHASETGGFLS